MRSYRYRAALDKNTPNKSSSPQPQDELALPQSEALDFTVDFKPAVHEHSDMQIQQRHEWKAETEEGMRHYRAIYHSKFWKFTTSMKGTRRNPAVWEKIENVADEHWEALRDVLFRKYQRKRCPWKLIEDIDKTLGKEP